MASRSQGTPPDPTARLLGHSPSIQALRVQIRHLAAFDTLGNPHVPTLLLQGETGTGKGLVARVMHDSGPRAAGPFVEVNCAAIPDTLLEAELFGYEAGAFSDAKRAKPGLFEAASGGTLFLDEIDALPLVLQGKLLTALEGKRVRRLGAVREQAVDVKLIAAAQTELSAAAHAGRFRADLYHRLAVVVLTLPPLRARGEDVLVLAQAYLQRYAAAHRVRPKRLSPGAEVWLRGHRWPGNVRELSHLLERVTLLSPEPVVDADTLARLSLPPEEPDTPTGARPPAEADQLPDEAARIRQALQDAGGNIVQAARRLGVSRGGLRYRMQRYGLTPPTRGTGPSSRAPRPAPASPVSIEEEHGLQTAAAPTPAPAWEQKLVAVLAIDLVFPTALEPAAPAFEPWTAARGWEQAIGEKVRGFGGLLLQRLSSLLIVAFGVPRTLEQLPQRAVHAAFAVRQLVTDAPAGASAPVPEVRQAVHLGTMLVETQAGALPARYQAEGETLSGAVRLLGHAGPGELLVSSQVGRLVAGWCELQARDVPAGAGPPPMPAYQVTGLMGRRAPHGKLSARALSRFVGRARELAALGELFAHVARGRGQVVGLVGEPGVGKSRLVYEFTHALQAQDGVILEASAVAYGQATPYLPMRDLLQAYFGLDDGDDERAIREKVDKLLTLDTALQPTRPAVLALLDVPVEDPEWQALEAPQRRQRTLDALKRLWLRESQVQPLLLVVENLHWIDTETQAVLDDLVESLPAARLMLLVTYRPEYQHGWGHKTYYTQLRLDPLPLECADELLRTLLGEDAGLEPLKQHVIGQTEGNPFFVEESVRTLVETQVLVGEWGAYRLAKPVLSIQVPATVQAVLATRIDRLPPAAKQLLQTAAVIGREVPCPLLEAIAEVPAGDLEPSLAHLQRAEFLYEMHQFPERTYTFKHALTQEVTYGSLLPERRRALHARLVPHIEAHNADRLAAQVERLARHAVRGELWEQALVYCRQAGLKAAMRSAHREAVGYFEQALATLSHLPEARAAQEQAIELRFSLRNALLPLGVHAPILDHLRAAQTLAEALHDERRLGQACAYLAEHYRITGESTRALELGERALAVATALGDVALEVMATFFVGTAQHTLGNYRRATDCFRRNVASLTGERSRERFGMTGLPAVMSRTWLVSCLADLGAFDEGAVRGEEAVRLAEAADHPFSLTQACFALGTLYLRQGDVPQAIPVLERGRDVCQDAHIRTWLPAVAAVLGYAYTLVGRVAEALPLLQQAAAQSRSGGLSAGHSRRVTYLSEAYLLSGHRDEAMDLARRALAFARDLKARGNEAYALRLLGEIHAHEEPTAVEAADAAYRQALALAEELGMRPLLAHCHLGLGTLYTKVGRRAQARTALATAIELFEAMAMTFWRHRAEATRVHTA